MKSILNLISEFDPLYEELYQWMVKRVPSLDAQCRNIWEMLSSHEFEFEKNYSSAVAKYKGAMKSYKKILEDIKIDKVTNENINKYLLLITSVYKSIFIDAQIDRIIYNAILNKGLFVKIMMDDLSDISGKLNMSYLQILSILDKTTSNKYIVDIDNGEYENEYKKILSLLDLQDRLKLNYLKEGLSQHKKWEIRFSYINNEIASPLIVEIRGIVWDLLESINKLPLDEDTKYESWKLIDYLEDNIIPKIWEEEGNK